VAQYVDVADRHATVGDQHGQVDQYRPRSWTGHRPAWRARPTTPR
jgi:hypothetical protein